MSRCTLCRKSAETRPYGPGGADVCFACGMLDETEAVRRFTAAMDSAAAIGPTVLLGMGPPMPYDPTGEES